MLAAGGTFIVVCHGTQVMLFHQQVQGDGSLGRSFQLEGVAFRADIESRAELGNLGLNLSASDFTADGGEFIHLYQFEMGSEGGRLPLDVGIDIEHSAVVVAEDSKPVVAHSVEGLGCEDPLVQFLPGPGRLEVTGDDVVFQAAAIEDAAEFRYRAGLAVLQPHPGHLSAVPEGIDCGIVDLRIRLDIQEYAGTTCLLGYREDSRGEAVSRDVDKKKVHAGLPQKQSGLARLLWRIDHSRIDDRDIGVPSQMLDNSLRICSEIVKKSVKLIPVSVQSGADEADFGHVVHSAVYHSIHKYI